MVGSLFRTKIFRKKFFDDAYFREVISTRDFSVFMGLLFGMKNLGKKFLQKVVPLFFESIFWGKKFVTNCSA